MAEMAVPRNRATGPQKTKNPLRKWASRKRLMGLEPTTFCMAISREGVFGASMRVSLRSGCHRIASDYR
jgi:hypothetical protein